MVENTFYALERAILQKNNRNYLDLILTEDNLDKLKKTVKEQQQNIVAVRIKVKEREEEKKRKDALKELFQIGRYSKELGIIVIADLKVEKKGEEADKEAEELLNETSPIDMITINPDRAGQECVQPFVRQAVRNSKAVFVKASTPEEAKNVTNWGRYTQRDEYGYNHVGVEITKEFENKRVLMPESFILLENEDESTIDENGLGSIKRYNP